PALTETGEFCANAVPRNAVHTAKTRLRMASSFCAETVFRRRILPIVLRSLNSSPVSALSQLCACPWKWRCSAEWSGDGECSPDHGETEILRKLERPDGVRSLVVHDGRHQCDRVADEQYPP